MTQLQSTWHTTKRNEAINGMIYFLGDDIVPMAWIADFDEHRHKNKVSIDWIAPPFIAIDKEHYEMNGHNKVHTITLPKEELGEVGGSGRFNDAYYTFRDRRGQKTFKTDEIKELREKLQNAKNEIQRLKGETVSKERDVDRARKRSDERLGSTIKQMAQLASISSPLQQDGGGRGSQRQLQKLIKQLQNEDKQGGADRP